MAAPATSRRNTSQLRGVDSLSLSSSANSPLYIATLLLVRSPGSANNTVLVLESICVLAFMGENQLLEWLGGLIAAASASR